jgi:hypothetical protein
MIAWRLARFRLLKGLEPETSPIGHPRGALKCCGCYRSQPVGVFASGDLHSGQRVLRTPTTTTTHHRGAIKTDAVTSNACRSLDQRE